MSRKSILDIDALEKVFQSDNAKYDSMKRFLARTIHRYLKSNPELRKIAKNECVYQKCVEVQAKYFLEGYAHSQYSEMIDRAEWLCDIEIATNKLWSDSDSVLQSIMDTFLNMT